MSVLWSVIGPPLASNVTCPAFTTQAGCNVLTVALLKVQRNVGCSELDSKRRQKLFTPSLRSLFLSTLWAFRLGTGWALDCRVQPRQTYAVRSSHEKQTAIKPRASRDREFYIEESSLPSGYITSMLSIFRRGSEG